MKKLEKNIIISKSYLMLAQLWKNTFIDINSLKDGGINEKTKYLYRH